MLETIKPSMPLLIEDLGMQYATETSKKKSRYGIYKCSCGNEFRAVIRCVVNGHTKSCGCYNIKCIIERNTTHGLKYHPLYTIWTGIIQRTTNENEKCYKDYGGRGISICDKWRNNFKVFYDWCTINGWSKGLEIDRIDNNKGYSPDNCRLVTRAVNVRNTRILKITNTSGYRGVCKKGQKFEAKICVDYNTKYLGLFSTAIEAAKAYDTYVVENNLEHTKNFK